MNNILFKISVIVFCCFATMNNSLCADFSDEGASKQKSEAKIISKQIVTGTDFGGQMQVQGDMKNTCKIIVSVGLSSYEQINEYYFDNGILKQIVHIKRGYSWDEPTQKIIPEQTSSMCMLKYSFTNSALVEPEKVLCFGNVSNDVSQSAQSLRKEALFFWENAKNPQSELNIEKEIKEGF
jgi:hypothetical protein